MTFSEQDKRNLLNAIADLPVTFVYSSTTYTNAGTIGSLVTSEGLDDGGFLPDPDLTITTTIQKLDANDALTNRFSTQPGPNDQITVNGTVYRIDNTVEDELTSALVLNLMSAHK